MTDLPAEWQSRRTTWKSLVGWQKRELSSVVAASSLSTAGNSIHVIASSLLALSVTGSAASVPIIAIVAGIPPILLLRVVQWSASRLGTRLLLVLVDLGAGCAALTLPLAWLVNGHVNIWEVYGQEIAMATFSAFYAPASRGWGSSVSEQAHQLALVNTALSASMEMASILGWGLGGVAAAVFTPIGAIAVNAGTFFVSAGLQSAGFRGRLRRGPEAAFQPVRGTFRALKSTLGPSSTGHFGRPLLMTMVVQRLQFSLVIPFLALSIGLSESLVGLANAGFSVGATVGAALLTGGAIGRLARRHPLPGVGLMFLALLAFTLVNNGIAAVILYALVGFASASVVALQTRFQAEAADRSTEAFAVLGAGQALGNIAALSILSLILANVPVAPTFSVVAALGVVLIVASLVGLSTASERRQR